LVLPSLEPPAHTLRALESCWHAREGLPCCPVTSRGSSGASNGRAGEEYQVRARYQVRANPLLPSLGSRMPTWPAAGKCLELESRFQVRFPGIYRVNRLPMSALFLTRVDYHSYSLLSRLLANVRSLAPIVPKPLVPCLRVNPKAGRNFAAVWVDQIRCPKITVHIIRNALLFIVLQIGSPCLYLGLPRSSAKTNRKKTYLAQTRPYFTQSRRNKYTLI